MTVCYREICSMLKSHGCSLTNWLLDVRGATSAAISQCWATLLAARAEGHVAAIGLYGDQPSQVNPLQAAQAHTGARAGLINEFQAASLCGLELHPGKSFDPVESRALQLIKTLHMGMIAHDIGGPRKQGLQNPAVKECCGRHRVDPMVPLLKWAETQGFAVLLTESDCERGLPMLLTPACSEEGDEEGSVEHCMHRRLTEAYHSIPSSGEGVDSLFPDDGMGLKVAGTDADNPMRRRQTIPVTSQASPMARRTLRRGIPVLPLMVPEDQDYEDDDSDSDEEEDDDWSPQVAPSSRGTSRNSHYKSPGSTPTPVWAPRPSCTPSSRSPECFFATAVQANAASPVGRQRSRGLTSSPRMMSSGRSRSPKSSSASQSWNPSKTDVQVEADLPLQPSPAVTPTPGGRATPGQVWPGLIKTPRRQQASTTPVQKLQSRSEMITRAMESVLRRREAKAPSKGEQGIPFSCSGNAMCAAQTPRLPVTSPRKDALGSGCNVAWSLDGSGHGDASRRLVPIDALVHAAKSFDPVSLLLEHGAGPARIAGAASPGNERATDNRLNFNQFFEAHGRTSPLNMSRAAGVRGDNVNRGASSGGAAVRKGRLSSATCSAGGRVSPSSAALGPPLVEAAADVDVDASRSPTPSTRSSSRQRMHAGKRAKSGTAGGMSARP